jgi:hypothetical protein
MDETRSTHGETRHMPTYYLGALDIGGRIIITLRYIIKM